MMCVVVVRTLLLIFRRQQQAMASQSKGKSSGKRSSKTSDREGAKMVRQRVANPNTRRSMMGEEGEGNETQDVSRQLSKVAEENALDNDATDDDGKEPSSAWDIFAGGGKKQARAEKMQAPNSRQEKPPQTGSMRSNSTLTTRENSIAKNFHKGNPVVTPGTTVRSGLSNSELLNENRLLKRQLNGLSRVGIRDLAMVSAVRKYTKADLFHKVKFVTNKRQLARIMGRVMDHYNVDPTDRLHWEQTYAPDVCDAINQKRNNVAQNLRKIVASE